MNIVAHALWSGIGLALARRRRPVATRTAAATLALAVVPDLAQLLPLLGLALVTADAHVLVAYTAALPGYEPALPAAVALWSHHLHCALHSAVVAAVVTLALYAVTRSLWVPLLGWWSHIVIDVFTHSADFYPAPVLYPFTQWGFDGVPWNTPATMAANYTAIVLVLALLVATRQRRRPRSKA